MMSPIYFAYQLLLSKRMPVMLLALLLGQYSIAQTDSVFKMTKEHGHFFCQTTLNGVNAKVMMETGVPGLMMSEAFYEAHKDSLKLDVKESDEKIRHITGFRHVKFTAQARMQIGDAIFEGPVKIMQEDQAITLPLHMLHHPSDSSAIVWLDLSRLQFRVDKLTICDRTYHDDTVGVTKFKGLEGCGMLGLKFFTMPVVFDFDENKLYLCK